MNPYAISIFTDGSSKVLFGFSAGAAGVINYPDFVGLPPEELSWSYSASKIGAMEIAGINNSLEWIIQHEERLRSLGIKAVEVFCDNMTVVDCCSTYAFSWSKTGWKKKDGGSIKNLSHWKRYISLRRRCRLVVTVAWVKGKSTPETKRVDSLAKHAAESQPRFINLDLTLQKAANRISGNKFLPPQVYCGQPSSLVRVYYHFRVNTRKDSDVEVRFELIQDGEIMGCYFAYCSIYLDSQLIDRKNYYVMRFDLSVPSRPIITHGERLSGNTLDELKSSLKRRYGTC